MDVRVTLTRADLSRLRKLANQYERARDGESGDTEHDAANDMYEALVRLVWTGRNITPTEGH